MDGTAPIDRAQLPRGFVSYAATDTVAEKT
jgi:hypothetical protein